MSTRMLKSGSSLVFLLACVLVFMALPSTVRADVEASCLDPDWSHKRDDLYYYHLIEACHTLHDKAPNAQAMATIGYMHRNGYFHIRDITAAKPYYDEAISLDSCNRVAVCGMASVSGLHGPSECDVSCELPVDGMSGGNHIKTPKERAREILADLRGRTGVTKIDAQELELLFDSILSSDQNRLSEAYQKLCLAHFKRALATVSLGRQAHREMMRRQKLIDYHRKRVDEDNSASSQAALVDLAVIMEKSEYEIGIFEGKYHQAIIAASACDADSMEGAYGEFEREIANVQTSGDEEQLFEQIKKEVATFRDDKSIQTTEYRRLTSPDG